MEQETFKGKRISQLSKLNVVFKNGFDLGKHFRER